MLGLSVATVVGVPAQHLAGPGARVAQRLLGRRPDRRPDGRLLLRVVPHVPGNREATVLAEPLR